MAGKVRSVVARLVAFADRQPVLVAALAAVVVLIPRLGKFGFWDPYEINIADVARQIAKTGDWSSVYHIKPPLTLWLAAVGVKLFGVSELGARLPLALLAIAGVAATALLGARLSRPRAGLFAGLVLISSPLFVFEARQLTSDIGAVSGMALAACGLVGLAWPRRVRAWVLALDGLMAVAGMAIGFLSAGLFVGVLAPVAAVALASLAGLFGFRDDTPPEADEDTEGAPAPRRFLGLTAALGGALALTILGVVLYKVWPFATSHASGTPGMPGMPTPVGARPIYLPALGGTWRLGEPPPSATFDVLINQVVYGLFPWSALAPIAMLRFLLVKRRDRRTYGGLVLLLWATIAWVAGTYFVRRVGDLRYPALAAIAVGVGLLLDDLLAARKGEDDRRVPGAAEGLPLVAIFVLCAAVQIARDTFQFPDELVSVHLLQTAKYPAESHMAPVVLVLGMLFALAAFAGIGTRTTPIARQSKEWWAKLREDLGDGIFASVLIVPLESGEAIVEPVRRAAVRGLPAALALGVLFGPFFSWVYTPRISEHFSYKNVFEGYFEHRRGAEPLGVMGIPGSGPEYYAKGPFERLPARPQLVEFLKKPERVFAIAPSAELCGVNQSAGAMNFAYHVLGSRNSRFMLLTNQLADGEVDENPLFKAILRQPPAKIASPVAADYEGKIQLLGYEMPATVEKGSKFTMTLFFKVTQALPTNYKLFVHFDSTKGGQRFQGDHDPIGGRCGTTFWQAGDYIVDTFEVTAGGLTDLSGDYEAFTGFFVGANGAWKNMTVASGNGDSNNRVRLGIIHVN